MVMSRVEVMGMMVSRVAVTSIVEVMRMMMGRVEVKIGRASCRERVYVLV